MVYVIDDDESVRKALKRLFRSVDLRQREAVMENLYKKSSIEL